jgi:Tol biopolymer transport system component
MEDLRARAGSADRRHHPTAANGDQGNSESFDPSISADGRYVTFASGASDLVPGDTNGVADVFVVPINCNGGETAAVSVAENSTAVATVIATDPDVGQTLSYSISGGADAAKFSIGSSTGRSRLFPHQTLRHRLTPAATISTT